ncbi:MAG: DUF4974 domain-containing protein [Bacteroidaceae bacterium]|nr:DUF4974 domain-containing protein [Bacteroidaceae bacterium]
MKENDALILRDRFFRGETTADEERRLVSYLLADDCTDELATDRHAILMLVKEEVINGEKLCAATPLYHGRGARRAGWVFYRKIAAVFLAAVFLGGLVWASIQILAPYNPPAEDEKVGSLQAPPAGGLRGTPILFADVRLDSMLAIVSQHYGKAVSFGNEQLKGLRIHTKWNQEDSLAVFIESLNELDGLQLTELRDTIFVQKGGAQ